MVSQAGAERSARPAQQNVIAGEIKYSWMFNIYRGGNVRSECLRSGARRRVWLSKPSEVRSLFPGVLFNMPVKSVRFPLRRGPMQGSLQRAGPCFNSFSQGNQRSRWSAVAGGSTFTATGQVGLRPAVWSYMWAIRLKNE